MKPVIPGVLALLVWAPDAVSPQAPPTSNEMGLEELSAAATNGDPGSQYALGIRYADGVETDQNPEAAVRWLREAITSLLPVDARQGKFFLDLEYDEPYAIQPVDQHGPAWGMNDPIPVDCNLGVQFSQGLGSDNRDFPEAAKRFRRAARAGFAPAQYNLALLYATGCGVASDAAETCRLLRDAAEQGSVRAMHALGVALRLGRRCQFDAVEAGLWFSQAASRGHPAALCCLGVLEVETAPASAVERFAAAAAAGNVPAQYNLGLAHSEAVGVARDLEQAIRCFRDAGVRLLGYQSDTGVVPAPRPPANH